jgi:hypothetical protein
MRRVYLIRSYEPEWDDWLWYAVLFVDATAMVLLLAVGIRDAWDIVTYLAIMQLSQPDAELEHQAPRADPA